MALGKHSFCGRKVTVITLRTFRSSLHSLVRDRESERALHWHCSLVCVMVQWTDGSFAADRHAVGLSAALLYYCCCCRLRSNPTAMRGRLIKRPSVRPSPRPRPRRLRTACVPRNELLALAEVPRDVRPRAPARLPARLPARNGGKHLSHFHSIGCRRSLPPFT